MVLCYDLIEYIAGFADIDSRRAMGFLPRKLRKDQKDINIHFKKVAIFLDPHIVLTVCGERSMKSMIIYHPLDERPYSICHIKTTWGGINGTERNEYIVE